MKTQTFKFNKLVRDKICQKLLDNNIKVKTALLDSPEAILPYFQAKLREEASEVAEASTVGAIAAELADCLEVIHGLLAHLKISWEALEQLRLDKRVSYGGFQKGTVVDTITLVADNPAMNYYLQNPAKYPQVNDA
ncbi:MAG: nucleoside triphosphate pyrophosphohydrolase [Bacteroidota bacterium]